MTCKSWKKSAADRRDARNIKEDIASKPPSAKKDTKKWCKGKVGVEHEKKISPMFDLGKQNYEPSKKRLVMYCSKCGKELEVFYNIGSAAKNPPEWVKEYWNGVKA